MVADALRREGARIEIHDYHFQPDTPDDIWLKTVGSKGWIVLTRDRRIRYNPRAKAALKQARVVAVTLIAKNTTGRDWADLFVRCLPEIEGIAAKTPPPALFTFGRNSKLKQLIL